MSPLLANFRKNINHKIPLGSDLRAAKAILLYNPLQEEMKRISCANSKMLSKTMAAYLATVAVVGLSAIASTYRFNLITKYRFQSKTDFISQRKNAFLRPHKAASLAYILLNFRGYHNGIHFRSMQEISINCIFFPFACQLTVFFQ